MAERKARSERGWRVASLLGFICCAAFAAAALTLDLAGFVQGADPAVAQGWTGALPGLALGIPGALLMWRRPGHPIAIVLLASGVLWAVDGFAPAWVNASTSFAPGLPGTAFAFWMFERFGAWLLVGVPLLLVLFPDGRLPEGRWRVVSLVSVGAIALLPLALLVAPTAELIDASDPLDPRLTPFADAPFELSLPSNAWTVIIPATRLAVPIGFIGAIAVVVHRRRLTDPVGRAQLRWLLWGASAAALGLMSWFALPEVIANLLSALGFAAFSASILVAITRYRLYEIDELIGWTLISAFLAVSFFVIDGMRLGLLGVSGPAGPVAAVSALTVGAIYLPLRERLRRAVRRLVSGRREEPFEVLIDLTDRLEHAGNVEEQLAAVADAAREAFLSPRAVLALHRPSGDPLTVDCGDGVSPIATRHPVSYRGRQLATLGMAAPRRPRLSRNDRRLLEALTSHAISAIRLGEAHDELNAARTRLVASREDERLRMRRELHDGIGSSPVWCCDSMRSPRNFPRSRRRARRPRSPRWYRALRTMRAMPSTRCVGSPTASDPRCSPSWVCSGQWSSSAHGFRAARSRSIRTWICRRDCRPPSRSRATGSSPRRSRTSCGTRGRDAQQSQSQWSMRSSASWSTTTASGSCSPGTARGSRRSGSGRRNWAENGGSAPRRSEVCASPQRYR